MNKLAEEIRAGLKVSGPAPTIAQLPLEDQIGTVREVNATGLRYVKVCYDLRPEFAWAIYNPNGTIMPLYFPQISVDEEGNIINSVIPVSGTTVELADVELADGQFAYDTTIENLVHKNDDLRQRVGNPNTSYFHGVLANTLIPEAALESGLVTELAIFTPGDKQRGITIGGAGNKTITFAEAGKYLVDVLFPMTVTSIAENLFFGLQIGIDLVNGTYRSVTLLTPTQVTAMSGNILMSAQGLIDITAAGNSVTIAFSPLAVMANAPADLIVNSGSSQLTILRVGD